MYALAVDDDENEKHVKKSEYIYDSPFPFSKDFLYFGVVVSR